VKRKRNEKKNKNNVESMLAVGDVGKCQIEPTSSGDQSIHKYNQERVDY
jgi:hypothetical protein